MKREYSSIEDKSTKSMTGGDHESAQQAPRVLTPAAQRALAEAEERRRLADVAQKEREKELGGRDGPDPVRYGDWENAGITSDF